MHVCLIRRRCPRASGDFLRCRGSCAPTRGSGCDCPCPKDRGIHLTLRPETSTILCRVPGNERADRIAKDAALLPSHSPFEVSTEEVWGRQPRCLRIRGHPPALEASPLPSQSGPTPQTPHATHPGYNRSWQTRIVSVQGWQDRLTRLPLRSPETKRPTRFCRMPPARLRPPIPEGI